MLVFTALKSEFVLLFAVCSFLLKITLSVSMLKSFDLKRTFLFNSILLLSKKFPSLAVINIFFFSLFIANFGCSISTLGIFFLNTSEFTLIRLIC